MTKFFSLLSLVGLVLATTSSSAHAAVVVSGSITLANSQVEVGANTSENPDVTGGAGGVLIPYVETGVFGIGAPFGGDNLDDGDVGVGNASDGTYAIADSNTTLSLDFGSAETVVGIAIYMGYGNRDDGIYTLKDAGGTVLGDWTISATAGTTNDGVDSFWITLDTPVTSTGLSIDMVVVGLSITHSFREIQVFAIPEPSSFLLIGFGLSGFVLSGRRRG